MKANKKGFRSAKLAILGLLIATGNASASNTNMNGPNEPANGEELGKAVSFTRGETLAIVNGVTIKGTDLAPFGLGKPGKEVSMPEKLYEYRLHWAIERELIIQEAKSEGIKLTGMHYRQLNRLRQSMRYDDAVVDPIGDQQATIKLEVQ